MTTIKLNLLPKKRCNKCHRLTPICCFYRDKSKKDGRRNDCKLCRSDYEHQYYMDNIEHRNKLSKDWYNSNKDKQNQTEKDHHSSVNTRLYRGDIHRKSKYGLTVDQYLAMVSNQENCCAICGAAPPSNRELDVDHDHKTGKVRGLLCNRCNRGIGFFKDSPDIIEMAAQYLRSDING